MVDFAAMSKRARAMATVNITSRTGFTPSEHQQSIIDLAKSSDKDLKIRAFAGASKTTTLVMVSEALPTKWGRYLTFSKALADEAGKKFPTTVECSTIHSLAFRAIRPKLSHSPKDWVNAIYPFLPDGIWKRQGWTFYKMLNVFAKTADELISIEHLEEVCNDTGKDLMEVADDFIATGNSILEGMKGGVIPCTHDFYIKLYSLLPKISLGVDYIMFDEQQDCSPIMLEIVRKVREGGVRIITVGDSYQAIYGFSGNIDALDLIKCELEGFLPLSYRYGQGIANLADRILAPIKPVTEPKIEGVGGDTVTHWDADLGSIEDCNAVICRTNRRCMQLAYILLKSDKKVYYRNINEVARNFEQLVDFMMGKVNFYQGFRKFESLLNQYRTDPLTINNGWLIPVVVDDASRRIFKDIIETLRETKHTPDCIEVITAHKSKGLDFDNVYVDKDLIQCRINKVTDETSYPPEELRLTYVAVTRVKKNLYLGFTMKQLDATIRVAAKTLLRQIARKEMENDGNN